MGQPKDRRKYLWTWALAGVICLAAGAVWAGGVVYVGEKHGSDDAFLGVTLTEEIDHPEGGARILDVVDDSPAEEAGIEEGDIIQRIDGDVIRGPGALSKRLEDKEPGDRVSIELVRDGRTMSFDVELGERSEIVHWSTGTGGGGFDVRAWTNWADEFGDQFSETWTEYADELDDSIHVLPRAGGLSERYFIRPWGRPKLGVQLSETTPELREHFGGNTDSGVLISKILPDTPAADAGLRVGDLIVAIDGTPVASSREIVEELRDKEGETFPVDVMRAGKSVSIEVFIPERDEENRSSGPRAFYMRGPLPRVPAISALPELPALPALPELPALRALPAPRALPALPEPPELPALPALPAPPALSGARRMKVV